VVVGTTDDGGVVVAWAMGLLLGSVVDSTPAKAKVVGLRMALRRVIDDDSSSGVFG